MSGVVQRLSSSIGSSRGVTAVVSDCPLMAGLIPSCHELRERPWALPTADACCWLLPVAVTVAVSSAQWEPWVVGEADREYEQH